MFRNVLFTISFLFSASVYSELYSFIPAKSPQLSINIEGKTQAGTGMHKIEILQLGHNTSYYKKGLTPTYGYYLIYYAGEQYGPNIIQKLDGHTPFLRQRPDGLIEVQFTKGNNGHTRAIYKHLGYTIEKLSESLISYEERLYHNK